MAFQAAQRLFAPTSCTRRIGLEVYRHGFRTSKNTSYHTTKRISTLAVVAGATTAVGVWYLSKNFYDSLKAFQTTVEARSEHTDRHISYKQRRFLKYASVEHDHVAFMTPQDFLESVIESDPRPRIGRRQLADNELKKIINKTPQRKYGSSQLFRNLTDQGIISYTEYLFLLSILTMPQTGFEVAFNVLDKDGNTMVDRDEFLIMERTLSNTMSRRHDAQVKKEEERREAEKAEDKSAKTAEKHEEETLEDKEKKAPKPEHKEKIAQVDSKPMSDDIQNTTMLVHLFGSRGREQLSYEQFAKFMDDLQQEVIELEFGEFSKGMPTISEEEFARSLLRYTYFTAEEDVEKLLKRLRKRLPEEKGISLQEFRDFFRLMNAMEDFTIALSFHIVAHHAITKNEFQRACRVCIGKKLSPRVVETIFALFDENNDERLSYREFLMIMKDRLHRGFRSHLIQHEISNWESFKQCLRQEMKKNTAGQ